MSLDDLACVSIHHWLSQEIHKVQWIICLLQQISLEVLPAQSRGFCKRAILSHASSLMLAAIQAHAGAIDSLAQGTSFQNSCTLHSVDLLAPMSERGSSQSGSMLLESSCSQMLHNHA